MESIKPHMIIKTLAIAIILAINLFPINNCWAMTDYSKQTLIEADFSSSDLRGVTFNLTNLLRANFTESDLRGASLFGAKLQDANMTNTDLREATLDSAVMENTNLTNAVLENAFAFNTKFTNVKIDGADFTNVPMRDDVLKELCLVAKGTNTKTGRKTIETLNCQ